MSYKDFMANKEDEDNKFDLVDTYREYSIFSKKDTKELYVLFTNMQLRSIVSDDTNCIDYVLCKTNYLPLESVVNRDSIKLLTDLKWRGDRNRDEDDSDYENEYKSIMEKIKDSYEKKYPDILSENRKGRYRFVDFYSLINKDDEILIKEGSNSYAGNVVDVKYSTTWIGTIISIVIVVISNIDGKFKEYKIIKKIPFYEGYKTLSDLNISFVNAEIKENLTKRGRKIFDLLKEPTYISYIGQQTKMTNWGPIRFRADGRIMIDPRSYAKFDSNGSNRLNYGLFDGVINEDDDDDKDTDNNLLVDENCWKAYPAVFGFSFVTKLWGMFDVESISPIEFRTDAYDKLVLDEKTKELILALVTTNSETTDIISAKGNGTIFLLHGAPGVGKTLTAEAIAETLKRPLYSVSVGELGTNPESLEDSLRDILELATAWDAVLLLDEADVFLEARSDNDIERNAMVGVFLRLLEYHQGVLFLTTNRAHNFDPAFFSRISVAIKYPDTLDESTRRQIWDNLAKLNKVNINSEKLGTYDNLNGREIRNILKISVALAKYKKVELTTMLVEEAISSHLGFKKALTP